MQLWMPDHPESGVPLLCQLWGTPSSFPLGTIPTELSLPHPHLTHTSRSGDRPDQPPREERLSPEPYPSEQRGLGNRECRLGDSSSMGSGCARYRGSPMSRNGAHSVLSLLVEIWGRQSSSLKSSYILLFCKSICLNTFRLKGKNVSAFQGGRSPWVRLAVYAQSVCMSMCVFVCVLMCVCAHSPPAHLPGVPVRL